jgi:hypothetical protein
MQGGMFVRSLPYPDRWRQREYLKASGGGPTGTIAPVRRTRDGRGGRVVLVCRRIARRGLEGSREQARRRP